MNKKRNFWLTLVLAWIAVIGSFSFSVQAQQPRVEDFFEIQNQPNPPPFPDRRVIGPAPAIQGNPPPVFSQQPEIIYSPQIQGPTFGSSPNVPAQSNPFPYFPYPSDPFGSGVQPSNSPQPSFGPFSNPNFWGPGNRAAYEGTNSSWLPSVDWNRFQQDYLTRLFERPRAKQTYIFGDRKENELGINDIELATTVTWQNFLQSNQPLRITPGFIFHFWNGPNSAIHPGFDLPPQAYSIFLSLDHLTNPANQVGLETSLMGGFYSDFDNDSSDGLRLTGRVLGWSRWNSYTIGKIGVEYLDRVKVKMLPAFGVYMTPNPDLKLDLAFPRTKLSHRIPNYNDFEAWVYVGGEYGGGSWVIERMGGMNDQVDINDVRAYLGVEWMGPRRVTGFLEAGYVFNREILYRSAPLIQLDLNDSFMIRSGFAF